MNRESILLVAAIGVWFLGVLVGRITARQRHLYRRVPMINPERYL
jgi:hypothetical protein